MMRNILILIMLAVALSSCYVGYGDPHDQETRKFKVEINIIHGKKQDE